MKINYRIGKGSAFLMLGFALIIDLFKMLLTFLLIGLFVNWIITLFAYLMFFIWYAMKGIRFRGKKAVAFFGSFLVEMVPALDLLPATVFQALITIAVSRTEDRLGIKLGKGGLAGNIQAQKMLARQAGGLARASRVKETEEEAKNQLGINQ